MLYLGLPFLIHTHLSPFILSKRTGTILLMIEWKAVHRERQDRDGENRKEVAGMLRPHSEQGYVQQRCVL